MAGALALALMFAGGPAVADSGSRGRLDRLEIEVTRAEDLREIKKLQRAYGYYADRGLWDELANLFTDDATANYPSGGFDGNASIRAMFVQNLGQGKAGLAEGRIYNHTILQPVVDLSPDGASATGRWRVLGMLGRFGGSATWADSLYRFDYVKRDGRWKIRSLVAYAGSGGSYDTGWTLPKPRPPGAADTSPVRFNLAHPADRPWIDPCEADVSVCVVPFPYPNRGAIRAPVDASAVIGAARNSGDAARAADLTRRAQRVADEQSVLNLQHAYGYALDRGRWDELVALFAPDGTREVGQGGVYVGRKRIRASMELTGPEGLRDGQLNDHLQLEPIVDVAVDGRTAKGRIFELAFVGGGGQPARLVQNVQENGYVRRDGRWMIQSAHHYTILITDYDLGWAKSALPARASSPILPPDRPPSSAYEVYPKVFTPPFHFADASTEVRAGSVAIGNAPSPSRVDSARRQVARAMDYHEIENLIGALGYYTEKSLWSDVAALFTEDGALATDAMSLQGRERILSGLRASRPEGPVPGALNSQLVLQPVIHVAADGRSARVRSRVLGLSRDAGGRPMWGSDVIESELRNQDGVWRLRRVRVHPMWNVAYRGGWATPVADAGQIFPSRYTPPFHYRRP